MILKKEEKIYRSFIISICLVIAVGIAAVFLGINIQTRKLIIESLHSTAKAHFETIVATRSWNAGYGGVYVEKKPGVESNPYIENPDVTAKDGRVFTLRNPAMMTREISEHIGNNPEFSFRITSKKTINPKNAPDAFELTALDLFEKGAKEFFDTQKIAGKTYFRYVGPVYVQKACLKCHAKQGYKVGDVRGGISVMFNIDEVYKQLDKNALLILLLAVITASLLIVTLWYLTKRLTQRIAEIRKQIEEMAIKDGLTGVFNRKYALIRFEEEFDRAKRVNRDMCCIMLDIDFFKKINDKYGHLAGDEVLKETAGRVKAITRKYDVLGRYGGEEFIIIMPDTGIEAAKDSAQRIREEVKARPVKDITVTISLGVAMLRPDDGRIEDIIKRADEKLYEAKEAGRDCVRF